MAQCSLLSESHRDSKFGFRQDMRPVASWILNKPSCKSVIHINWTHVRRLGFRDSFSPMKYLLGRTEMRTRERKEWHSMRTVFDIPGDYRVRVATCSLRTAIDLRRIIILYHIWILNNCHTAWLTVEPCHVIVNDALLRVRVLDRRVIVCDEVGLQRRNTTINLHAHMTEQFSSNHIILSSWNRPYTKISRNKAISFFKYPFNTDATVCCEANTQKISFFTLVLSKI